MSECNSYHDDFLQKLIEDFFRGSLKYSLQPQDVKSMTWDKQTKFLNSTVQSQLLKKYPVNNEFSRLFFKKLIGYLEPIHEIHDDFYTYLCSTMRNEGDKSNFCYRHYVIGKSLDNIVTIKETKNMVINGTTGMRTWEAALMLSDWALCNKTVLNNKKVLELGSGVGFTGVTISKLCDISSITLTDCHNDVLNAICDNIEINFPGINRNDTFSKIKFQNKKNILEVMMLDWNCIDDIPIDLIPDVIIGSDIVYDPTIIISFCSVIKYFITKNKYLEIYIANIIRNQYTCDIFLKTLDEMNLIREEVIQSQSIFIEWEQSIDVMFLKISAINQ